MPGNRASRKGLSVGLVVLGVLGCSSFAFAQPEASGQPEDKSRFSDQPAPLALEDFPGRPPLLLELGDHFLGTGNLQKGITLPTGEVWSPDFYIFGTMRTALQSFASGNSPRISEWANRVDLFGNLQLSPTERIIVGFEPVDQNFGTKFTSYTFQPKSEQGWTEAFSPTPITLFFEGELDQMFPKLDPSDRYSLDYSFAVGRQPLTLQEGILVNDDSIDMISITRNALRIPGGSTLRISPWFAWDRVARANNVVDHSAQMYGVDMAADFPVNTVEGDFIYTTANNQGDGTYLGLGSIQRIGKVNTTFRVNQSFALEQNSPRVTSGTLLTSEMSYTMPYGEDILYLNGWWGLDQFASAARDPSAGGPLGQIGILNAAVGIGRYGAPLGNSADHSAGGAVGYQMFFGELRRRQLVFEIGGRAPTKETTVFSQRAAEGLGVRFQQALGRRFIVILDSYGVHRDVGTASYGGRLEFLVKL